MLDLKDSKVVSGKIGQDMSSGDDGDHSRRVEGEAAAVTR
ncbi:hypothetical protein COLO4_03403 [Corchorus olitorius]|uniref:Uncharacterized protein n=1 Tax=Corchorus olitorius TaxID=93759 RepID=A0A1R3KYL8_9ROSI|nr:hypothetical protein COLO4_03403 [Corchorus olitorius]